MGTKFFITTKGSNSHLVRYFWEDEPCGVHIGKRSFAGPSSFSWAMSPHNLAMLVAKGGKIHDEYRREFSFEKFHAMLQECPLQNHDDIGH